MKIEYSAAKNRWNIRKRGINFDTATELLEGDPITVEDTRQNYRERRVVAYGSIGGRLHVCVYTMRGEVYRIISLRKANRREINGHRAAIVRRGEEVGQEDRLGAGRRDDR